MKLVGFFREMDVQVDDAGTGSLHDHLVRAIPYRRDRLIAYLRSGHPIFDITELTTDVIGGRFHIAGGVITAHRRRERLARGSRLLRRALHGALPPDFLQFVEAHGFAVPPVGRDRLIEVSTAATELLGFRPSRGSGPR